MTEPADDPAVDPGSPQPVVNRMSDQTIEPQRSSCKRAEPRWFNPLRPRYPSPDYPLSIQRKWLPKMKMHTSHSNLQFIVTSPSLFALKLSINVAHVSNYSPDIFNLEQRNTVSRKKILFTAITVIFQQVYM